MCGRPEGRIVVVVIYENQRQAFLVCYLFFPDLKYIWMRELSAGFLPLTLSSISYNHNC